MWRALIHALSEAVLRWFRHRDRARIESAERSVVEGDAPRLNKALDRLLRVLLLAVLPAALGGCASYTAIPADREVVPMVHAGREGWFVPNARMLDIIRALDRAHN